MSIESNVFKKYSPDYKKILKYGFKKIQSKYVIEKFFKNNLFKASIIVQNDGSVSWKVLDIENNDEYLPLKIENNEGAYVGEVKAEYIAILEDIRRKCFSKNYFASSQSNRITNLIIEKYGNEPEFLWEKYDGTGIFRNPASNKWYGIIMDVDRSRLQPDKKGAVDVLNVKLLPEEVLQIIKEPNIYPAYHMNKKHWISMIMDDSLSDDKVMELIEKSHRLTEKNKIK